jgi:hypothetical protein
MALLFFLPFESSFRATSGRFWLLACLYLACNITAVIQLAALGGLEHARAAGREEEMRDE